MTILASSRMRTIGLVMAAAVFALAFSIGLSFSGPVAMASPTLQGSTTVTVSPATLALDCGETATVEIQINDVEDLFGVDIKVSYDPAILEVVDSNTTPGTQIEPGDLPDVSGGQGLIQVNSVDATSGTASYAAVRLNPAPAQSGSGTIAKITFKGKADGTSPITLVSAILADDTARAISAELTNGEATVTCDGTGPTDPPTATPPPGVTPPPPSGGECFHTVQPGDTLYSIARRFNTTVSALMAANKIAKPDWIFAGDKLVIPGCHGTPHDPGPYKPKPDPYKPPVGKDCHTHIVKPGESLFQIAYLTGDDVHSLAKRNGIINPDLIFAGQALTVCPHGGGYPGGYKPAPDPGYKPAPDPGYKPAPGPRYKPGPGYPKGKCSLTHVVKPGDTLFGIAWNYGVSHHTLAVVNNLANPHLIYAGQTLCIP